ncbi:Uncharacterized protein conserved in bacteria [Niallia circulans]|jgi:uncharacterized protein YktB (UPF0637 family)|uniref:UPF0637 protein ABW02_14605 n=1 Tax=Niallia circulans TaxID=1397 RepID=A0A0J1IIQ9_NIACI|nr:DUF1054 domain-containing protein [Niallia circulans]KLV25822.1 hypothetical protein ABW02_14605 [Niallia circulans]MDR4315738.1 DUF1054 domain-containing protein [Niallia circulans]MED3837016.1 DUF1054 domain-containing protein [Niallia circulans]MED4244086.1 DUF1054 domain-containing protein [Niallia circulans]MED4249180.1 DUF1054 domain-containing protein [Niallia circulans]
MSFTGFTQKDFDTFTIDGLDARMEAIQERIQPKFREIGTQLTEQLSGKLGMEMFLHIAKHARRTVNPPKDTWLAIANNKRGYKQHPHFQVGLFDDHLFIWLAYIYELPKKKEIAEGFLANYKLLQSTLPQDYVLSMDHMQKDAVKIGETNLEAALTRFRDVKKAEFLVGQRIAAGDSILSNGEELLALIEKTYDTLLPLYKLSLEY